MKKDPKKIIAIVKIFTSPVENRLGFIGARLFFDMLKLTVAALNCSIADRDRRLDPNKTIKVTIEVPTIKDPDQYE